MEKMKFDKKLLGLAIEKQCENMLALAPKTYSCSINSRHSLNQPEAADKNKPWINFNNIKTTATKCKGYSIQGKLNFKDYFDTYTDRKTLQGTNNNMQLKKDNEDERVIMTNISVTKNVLTATHTKYRVTKDFSTSDPLFLNILD
jgi:hypothetical protein